MLKVNDVTENNEDNVKIVPIIRQDTQIPMLVLLLIISCYIIAFRFNKDDVQNIRRMRGGICNYRTNMSAIANSSNGAFRTS
jgi:hypothetical protein